MSVTKVRLGIYNYYNLKKFGGLSFQNSKIFTHDVDGDAL